MRCWLAVVLGCWILHGWSNIVSLTYSGTSLVDVWLQLPDGRLLRATQPHAEDLPLWLEYQPGRTRLHIDGPLPAGNYWLGVSRWFAVQPMDYRLQLPAGEVVIGLLDNPAVVVDWLTELSADELWPAAQPAPAYQQRAQLRGDWEVMTAAGTLRLQLDAEQLRLWWQPVHEQDCMAYEFKPGPGLPGGLRWRDGLRLHRGLLLEVAEAEVIASLPEWLLLQPVSNGLQALGCCGNGPCP